MSIKRKMHRRAEVNPATHLRVLFDETFYLARYPDIGSSSLAPLEHYVQFGANEGRDPNPFFDGAWYREHYPDVIGSKLTPLLHYLTIGAAELRNPHPRFNAAFYADRHPEAATNPLLYHLLVGRARGYQTERPVDVADYLPARGPSPSCPAGVTVDIVIPVYRGLEDTRRCLNSVLTDPNRPPGHVIVVDDRSPEPDLAAWLDQLAAEGRIVLLRNRRNLGFVASANRGMEAAGRHDVVLLNSDTEVPAAWLHRLAGHAYAGPRIASISPFSNNATICSYPSAAGGPPAFDLPVAELDEVVRAANAGRQVDVPTTVGFCMYIRRAALDDVGAFDAKAFGRGYGEECDFCQRAAARGWRHRLACDTYVYHRGEVSFGEAAEAARREGDAALADRWPGFSVAVARHVALGAAEPFRFAITASLFRRSGRPTILFASHSLGGGVDRHIELLAERLRGRANVLLLQPSAAGAAISAPSLLGHGQAKLPPERLDVLAEVLASANVVRVHVHHMLGMDVDLRALIRRLRVPFDVTMHDYHPLCPQVNLLPWLDGAYCHEPGPAGCNACIAERPSHGAREILEWRQRHAWLFFEAERVLCPSEDVRLRLVRHGWGARAVGAPHERAPEGPWKIVAPKLKTGEKLRVAVIGVLAPQKGARAVIAVAEAAEPAAIDIRLIGYPEETLPLPARRRIKATGPYRESELPALLAKARPHVLWFPAQWPETWSYTLSAGIETGLPIVATRIGAFPERLADRRLTWLVEPDAGPETWIETFEQVRATLRAPLAPLAPRPALPDFYAEPYISPLAPVPRETRRGTDTGGLVDLRRPGRVSVVVIPERFETTGMPTPCAYIRLLQPLSHPAIAGEMDVLHATAEQALSYRADVIATHRHAIPDLETAEALARHCRQTGGALLYDLDDDLLNIPGEHPEARMLRPRSRVVERLLRRASAVWVSTAPLAERLAQVRRDIGVVPNGLDERLWGDLGPCQPRRQGPVRILCMGTLTHDGDFAIVRKALARLHATFGHRIAIDLIGVTGRNDLPAWVNRVSPSANANLSYPGFVNWITQQPAWDIGIAPLADTDFNRSKSAIKALDYAALGLAVLASDVPAYRGSLATLVANTETAWFEALSRMVSQPRRRRELAERANTAFGLDWTLGAQAQQRRGSWTALREHGRLRPPRAVGKSARGLAMA